MDNEDGEEAANLRFLALQTMVKRLKQTSSDNETDEYDDQDILMLRAAALKTITNKSNTQNSSSFYKDNELEKGKLLKEKKRSRSRSNHRKSTKKRTKYIKLNESNFNKNYSNIETSTRINNDPEREHFQEPNIPKLESSAESESTSVAANKDEVKKIVRNGCMQLSNLDSEKVDETMVLHITFSSSESSSDDSSNECDIVKKDQKMQKNMPYENNARFKLSAQKKNVYDVGTMAPKPLSIENRLKANNCMEQITVLMRNCESVIEKRDEQVTLLLDAYEKYQNYSRSLYSIVHAIKTARDELSKYAGETTDS